MSTLPPTYTPIPVKAARQIAQEFKKDVVVIIGLDQAHDQTHCTTYALDPAHKSLAATLGEQIMAMLGHALELSRSFEDFRHRSAADDAAREEHLRGLIARALAELDHIDRMRPGTVDPVVIRMLRAVEGK